MIVVKPWRVWALAAICFIAGYGLALFDVVRELGRRFPAL